MRKAASTPESSKPGRAGIEVPALAPCPKCREAKRLSAELHPGTTFARCDACNYTGPKLLSRSDVSRREMLAAVVRAWNNIAR
jgi:hypothetical protein